MIFRLRFDGIERVPGVAETNVTTPYHANGKTLPKFLLLRNLVAETTQKINFDDFLTSDEICNLHKIISSTIDPYVRGDEERGTCPILYAQDGSLSRPDMFNRRRPYINATTLGGRSGLLVISRCPLEFGVARTFDYGTISPGTLIATIAAALQPQNVALRELMTVYGTSSPYEHLETMEVKDTRKAIRKLFESTDVIDNTYAAGLAGDLAEVCVYQGPKLGQNVSVGLQGKWNDTYFPRWHILSINHKELWEMTDAEILAGIDSYFIAQKVNSWTSRVNRFRLSQVLDLFYQKRGVPAITIETKGAKVAEDVEWHAEVKRKWSDEGNLYRKSEKLRDKSSRFEKYINQISAQDGVSNACHRPTILQNINVDKLKEQTYRVARILQYTATSGVVAENQMRQNCDFAVDKFLIRASKSRD